MAEVPAIQNDKNIAGSKASYNVSTIQAVLKIIRPLFVKYKLALMPIESVAVVIGQTAVLNAKYKLIDLESGEYETVGGSGAGYDPSDKHVGKASTYAYKTTLLKTFCLATTDEDPDMFSSDDNVEQEKMRRKSRVSAIKTKEGLVAYIDELVGMKRIDTNQGPQFKAKVMNIKDEAELAAAVSYFSGYDT
jgi:hypothetical protein